MLSFLQRIGKALMLPVAVLPAAALLLRLGQEDLLDIPFMAAAGDAVFGNSALLFAIGVAVGIAKDHNGSAALAGAVGYFVLTYGTAAIDETNNMAVLGGILSGVIGGLLYNKFHTIKLPEWLGFFGGRRFVPIITALVMLLAAAVFGYAWPPIQEGINSIGEWIVEAGALSVGVFGTLNRLLIPIGLHHILNSLVWFVFGEYGGATGDLNRFFAGDPNAGIFMAGFFPIMMFGLPAACFAMIAAAKKERRKAVTGMLLGAAFTSFLTGITEPIEFLFMFLSPLLYVVHALLTGVSMSVSYLLDVHHGFGFSAGAIDYFLNFNIAQYPLLLAVQGIVFAGLYFVIFYFLIIKFDLQTPGREELIEGEFDESTESDQGMERKAIHYFEALGGKENVKSIDYCVTRLRLEVGDADRIKESQLKLLGAKGLVKLSSTQVQVVVGTNVEFLGEEMKKQR
ncbi:PTS sugar transporter [Bacillus coahuilensis m2-6]|uniref:N-acetylglucosamine-specific PTS transporter subunit IIBC n=1 Tax=Bacillus coahuilensis TaxID=408580 RepID=UPI0007503E8A|nr:N-acetylglucosamine-specific PTS transporter subunit IIBC [Bacillus coahuilensis]KUP06227.1 PTS sugar transporter [Bacillus coahuilensis m2-6]